MNTSFSVGNYTNHAMCNGPCELLVGKPNYPVPNLGVDQDILDSKVSLKEAETETGMKWNIAPSNMNQLMLEQYIPIDEELV